MINNHYKKLSLLSLLFFLLTNLQAQVGDNMTELSVHYPSNLTPGLSNQFNDVWGYTAPDGKEYAILGSLAGTYFINVSDPNNPVEISYEPGSGSSTTWRDFKSSGHYVYGVADGSGQSLQIFDMQYLPDSVVKIYDKTEFSSSAHNIFINNDRAYLIGNSSGSLDILCIEDPENPVYIGGIGAGGNMPSNTGAHDAFVRNDTVYFSGGNQGLYIIDAVDPEQLDVIGTLQSYPGAGYNHASWMSSDGDYLIMADETHGSPLKMVDIRDLSNLQAISTFTPLASSIAHNPFIKDCLAFISHYHMGLQVYDISDPLNPARTGFFDTDTLSTPSGGSSGYASNWGVYPYLPSGNILVSDRTKGLYVLSYDGTQPACSGNFDRVVENDVDTLCVPAVVVIGLESNLVEDSKLNIYPNPSSDVIHFDFNKENIEGAITIRVYDLRGQTLISKTNIENISSLDISTLIKGSYIIKIESVEEVYLANFIKD
jgi:choice-of-anchor B domain-containing protein